MSTVDVHGTTAVGGVAGKILGCYFYDLTVTDVDVMGTTNVGGLAGEAGDGEFGDILAASTLIRGSVSGENNVGLLVGSDTNGIIAGNSAGNTGVNRTLANLGPDKFPLIGNEDFGKSLYEGGNERNDNNGPAKRTPITPEQFEEIAKEIADKGKDPATAPALASVLPMLNRMAADFFRGDVARNFITHVNVLDGSVYVKDGASDMSLLAAGESLRVGFKEMISGDQNGMAPKDQEVGLEQSFVPSSGKGAMLGRFGTLRNPNAQVFFRQHNGGWQPATDGMVIVPGDEIRTAPGSQTEIILDEGKTGSVQLYGGSLFRIMAADTDPKTGDKTTMLDLAIGKVLVHAEKLKGKSRFEVRTPTALTGVRGTTFEVEVEPKGGM